MLNRHKRTYNMHNSRKTDIISLGVYNLFFGKKSKFTRYVEDVDVPQTHVELHASDLEFLVPDAGVFNVLK